MNAMSMLDQLLKSGGSLLDQAGQGARSVAGGANTKPFAAGAVTGGALALLLGSRSGRRLGGKALKYGSVAALGVMAFRAYQQWQDKQAAQGVPASGVPGVAQTVSAAQPMHLLPAPEAEQHGQAVLKAIIAAAKSDGHMDEREREMVEAELQRLQADPELRRWVDTELRRPIDPADVAAAASTPEMASEVYLASVLVVDQTTTMERAYLDELARQLKLPDGLKGELEAQAAR
jgi:uncharacterized membrane protein YebE (DUF533 family)